MSQFADRLVTLFENIHPLDRIARAGFVLRGVTEPESVSAHSHFVALLAQLIADEYPEQFDSGKVVAMALIHDLCESHLMDIPMPAADMHLKEAKSRAEQEITERLFEGFPKRYAQLHEELLAAQSPEARLIRGLDKAQMMIKIFMYQKEGRGRLSEFWVNPKNFNDFGLDMVSSLFDEICSRAGIERPR